MSSRRRYSSSSADSYKRESSSRERSNRKSRRYSRSRSPRNGGVSNPPPDHPDANEGNNVYVSNLSIETKEPDLKTHFSKYGGIKEVRIVRDPISRESRGFGFVTFDKPESATEAINELNDRELDRRRLRVERARRSKPHEATPGSYCGPAGASSKYRHAARYRRRSPSPVHSRRSRSR